MTIIANMLDRIKPSHLLVSVLWAVVAAVAGLAAAGPTGHDAVSCRVCHAGSGVPAADGAGALQQRCVGCHATALVAGPAPSFHGRGRCLDCHGFHAAGTVRTTVGTVDLAGLAGVDRAHCRACHDGKGQLADLSESHRIAGRLYHENTALLRGHSVSAPCLWCHSDARNTAWQAVPAADRIAFAEHASHPFGIAVRPGQGPVVRRMREVIDPRIPLPGGRVECVSCHQLTAGTEDLLLPFPEPKALCLGCHHLDETAGNPGLRVAGMGGN